MIKISLPDGSIKEFEKPVTGLDIANAISPRLATEVLFISVNGKIIELMKC
jgi:threonyl-tRNA synthetase